MRRTSGIYETTLRVFEIARDRGMPTYQAADLMAEERIRRIGDVRRNWIGKRPFRARS
jgi:leucine dehydrogenase